LFHVVDTITELNFDFDNTPRKFIDVGRVIYFGFADNVKQEYENKAALYFKTGFKLCSNKIKYVSVNVGENFEKFY
jgi:hypothetical protein